MLPFILATLGGYFIGSSLKNETLSTYDEGGEIDYDKKTKYWLENELHRLQMKQMDLVFKNREWRSEERDEQIKELQVPIDKIITLLYGKDFSGVGQKYKYAEGGKIEELLPKEKMLSLLKKTKFKSFDSSEIEDKYFNYSTSTYNPFDVSFALKINAYPCLIIIRKYDGYYEVKIGEDTGWVGGISFPNWDYIFEIPTINYEEFEKGLNKIVSDDRVVLYTEEYSEYKFYFVGSLEDAIEFAEQNGYKKIIDNGMYGMYFRSDDRRILIIGTFTDRQIEHFGGIKKLSEGGVMGNGGEVEDKIDELYEKSNFINSDFNWKLKLLELLQDNSFETYQIYQSLSKKQKDEVLQELYEVDNDMGSDGDGDIKTSKENLKILLDGAKNGNKYAEGGVIDDLITKINAILQKEVPNFFHSVTKTKSYFGNEEQIAIKIAASDYEINNVRGQYPQLVSLLLNVDTMELNVQVFGGNGGQRIYRDINPNDTKEKFYAMIGIKVPFRTPQKNEKAVLSAIQKFVQNYKQALRDNIQTLRYKNNVDYETLLKN
jgi:hypothetical protein